MADPFTTKMAKIVALSYQRTLDGEIDWSIGEGGRLTAPVGDSVVSIYEKDVRRGGVAETDMIFEISNPVGQSIESVSDVALKGISIPRSDISGWYTLMSRMKKAATRRATGAEGIIDEVLRKLSE